MHHDKEDSYDLNIRRFKKHERKFPWSLVRKLAIVLVLLGLLWYFTIEITTLLNNKQKQQKESPEDEIEVEIVD